MHKGSCSSSSSQKPKKTKKYQQDCSEDLDSDEQFERQYRRRERKARKYQKQQKRKYADKFNHFSQRNTSKGYESSQRSSSSGSYDRKKKEKEKRKEEKKSGSITIANDKGVYVFKKMEQLLAFMHESSRIQQEQMKNHLEVMRQQKKQFQEQVKKQIEQNMKKPLEGEMERVFEQKLEKTDYEELKSDLKKLQADIRRNIPRLPYVKDQQQQDKYVTDNRRLVLIGDWLQRWVHLVYGSSLNLMKKGGLSEKQGMKYCESFIIERFRQLQRMNYVTKIKEEEIKFGIDRIMLCLMYHLQKSSLQNNLLIINFFEQTLIHIQNSLLQKQT